MNNHIQTAISEQGIEAYLHAQQHKSLLRFLTCGSVDDGKSTLIGRLLHDSQQIYEDQLKALESDSQKLGTTGEKLDLALLVDGLQAEREQGITIDVAYRYFSTAKRKFIISDTPGHEQYTRNMATGASTCDLAIILIDARKGVLDQTRRHSFIASLLGIRQFIVAINKMDLVDYDQAVFERIKAELVQIAECLSVRGFLGSFKAKLAEFAENPICKAALVAGRDFMTARDGRRAEKVLVNGAREKVGEMGELSREMDEWSLLDEVGDMRGARRELDVHEAPARSRGQAR